MDPEQQDEPDDPPAPLPAPPWRQKRVDFPGRTPLVVAGMIIGGALAVVLIISGLVGLGIAIAFASGGFSLGTNK